MRGLAFDILRYFLLYVLIMIIEYIIISFYPGTWNFLSPRVSSTFLRSCVIGIIGWVIFAMFIKYRGVDNWMKSISVSAGLFIGSFVLKGLAYIISHTGIDFEDLILKFYAIIIKFWDMPIIIISMIGYMVLCPILLSSEIQDNIIVLWIWKIFFCILVVTLWPLIPSMQPILLLFKSLYLL